jgi:hypothetical protein
VPAQDSCKWTLQYDLETFCQDLWCLSEGARISAKWVETDGWEGALYQGGFITSMTNEQGAWHKIILHAIKLSTFSVSSFGEETLKQAFHHFLRSSGPRVGDPDQKLKM